MHMGLLRVNDSHYVIYCWYEGIHKNGIQISSLLDHMRLLACYYSNAGSFMFRLMKSNLRWLLMIISNAHHLMYALAYDFLSRKGYNEYVLHCVNFLIARE